MPGQRVRVLRFIARLNAGGPARHVVWLSRGLSEKGYETLLVSGEAPPGEDDLSSLAAEEGVGLCRIKGLSREIDPLADAVALSRFLGFIREFRPQIVHTHTAKAGFLGRLATRLWNSSRRGEARIRVVHTFHGNVLSGYFPPWKERSFRWLERSLAHKATDAVVVLSPQQRMEIVDRFHVAPASKVHVVPLAVDLTRFETLPDGRPFRREMGFEDDSFVVGIVGRISPVKNHGMFLHAAAKTLRNVPRSRFVVVGDGAGAERLRDLAASLELGDTIRFAGLRTDLASVYAGLDVVALTSRNEGTPLSLIEAMACGKPVVATDVGGVGDILTMEWAGPVANRLFVRSERARGLLVPSEDVDAFAIALSRLAGDLTVCREFGEAGRAYAFRYHGLPRLFDDMADLYGQLLKAPSVKVIPKAPFREVRERDAGTPESIRTDDRPVTGG
jgi:glycosyltransferase involved in cell wall biosynthesis